MGKPSRGRGLNRLIGRRAGCLIGALDNDRNLPLPRIRTSCQCSVVELNS